MHIKEIMVSGDSVKRVKAGQTVSEASLVMKQNKVSALPVVNEEDVVVGIVSARDLDNKCRTECAVHGYDYDPYEWMTLSPTGTDPQSAGTLSGVFTSVGRTKVNDIMTTAVITARPDEEITAAIRRMAESQINHLPVVGDDGRLVGIVARGDVIKALASQAEAG